MYPGNYNRRAAAEYRYRFRGDLSLNNGITPNNYLLRQQLMGVNPLANDYHAYRQMASLASHSPRSSMRHPPPHVSNSIPGQAMPNFQPNQPRPIYNVQQCPNMTPATTFPTPLPFSVASLVGTNTASPSSYTTTTRASRAPRASTQGQYQQQGPPIHPMMIPTSVPVYIPPYNIYGYGGSMNQMQQLAVDPFLSGQAPFPVPMYAAPSVGSGNRRATATVHSKYMDCSDISDSEDEDLPQDLRTNKDKSKLLMIDNRAPGSRVPTGVATPTVMPMQPEQSNNHKKFQYKAWTSGTEPVPGCSSAMVAGDISQRCDMERFKGPVSSSSSRPIEELVDELNLSPYISREEAASRLRELGCKEDVQREIDAFAAIISCGATGSMFANHSSQVPCSSGNGGTVNRSFAMNQVASHGIPRQSENGQMRMQMQQRESVIKSVPKMN